MQGWGPSQVPAADHGSLEGLCLSQINPDIPMMRSLPALAGKECVRPAQRRAVRSTDSAHVRFEREAASLRLPSLQPGMGLHAQHPKLPAAKMENSANCTTS